jgi:hypothetical protein
MATNQSDDDRGASILPKGLPLVYRPPRSPLLRFFWKWQIRFEATFALSMLEGWEKILIGTSPPPVSRCHAYLMNFMIRAVALMALFWGLLITGIYRYFPYHLQFLYKRTVYYLSGTEQNDWTSVRGVGAAVLSTKAPHAYAAEL